MSRIDISRLGSIFTDEGIHSVAAEPLELNQQHKFLEARKTILGKRTFT